MDFLALAQQCAPNVSPHTMAAIVQVESSFNPYAIGVVKGALPKQPKNKVEALQAVKLLLSQNKNFSMGIAQVNRYNLPLYKMSYEQAFDPCHSLRVGAKILEKCYTSALNKHPNEGSQAALKRAFSCYYSGNFLRGFRPDKKGDISYVDKVVNTAINQSKKPVKKQIVPAVAVPNSYRNTPLLETTDIVYTPPKTYPVLLESQNLPNVDEPIKVKALASTPSYKTNPASVLVFSRGNDE